MMAGTGFAGLSRTVTMITGEPGLGKSKTLQKIAHRLEQIPDLTVGVMQRPQSLLFTILCGDNRLPERFRSAELDTFDSGSPE